MCYLKDLSDFGYFKMLKEEFLFIEKYRMSNQGSGKNYSLSEYYK